ncbi:hypothetical protein Tco_1135945 [Tanacetum coccineum]
MVNVENWGVVSLEKSLYVLNENAGLSRVQDGNRWKWTPVSDYSHTLNGLWRQFDASTKLPTCYCAAQKAFRTHTDLIKEESHRGSSSSSGNKAQAFVFAAKVHNTNNFKKNSSAKNPNLVCTNPNCGLTGHTIEKCYKIVGYPEHIKKKCANNGNNNNQWSFSSNNSSTSTAEVPTSASSLTTDQIQQVINMLNSKPQSNIHANMVGTLYCSNSKTFFKVYKTDKGWIIDSGANQHMVTSLDKLENVVDISDLNLQIDHANGTTLLIKKVGNLKLSEKITLYYDVFCMSIVQLQPLDPSP